MKDFGADFAALTKRLDEARGYLKEDELRGRLAELEVEMAKPDLWDDPDRGKAVSSEFSAVNDDLTLLDALAGGIDDAQTLYELGVEEGAPPPPPIKLLRWRETCKLEAVKTWLIYFGPGDCAFRGRSYQSAVFREYPRRIACFGRFPMSHAMFDLGIAHFDFEDTLVYVNMNPVSLPHGSDGAAQSGFGRDVANHQAMGGSAETPIGH